MPLQIADHVRTKMIPIGFLRHRQDNMAGPESSHRSPGSLDPFVGGALLASSSPSYRVCSARRDLVLFSRGERGSRQIWLVVLVCLDFVQLDYLPVAVLIPTGRLGP